MNHCDNIARQLATEDDGGEATTYIVESKNRIANKKRLDKQWDDFVTMYDLPKSLLEFHAPPACKQLELFFLHLARISNGTIGDRPTVRYLQKLFILVKQLILMQSGFRIPPADVTCSINSLFRCGEAIIKAKPKPVAMFQATEDIVTYSWCQDEHENSIPLCIETDPSDWYTCPVVYFIALALADDVFKDLNDYHSIRIPPTANSHAFDINPDKTDLPVCRRVNTDGSISEKIMTGNSLWTYLADLGYRCGYKDKLSSYAFRRDCGNSLDDKVSTAKRRQVIGHQAGSDLTYQKYYSSTTIGIDLPSVVRGRDQDQEYIDFARCITFGRDTNAPMPEGSLINNIPYLVPEQELKQLQEKYPKRARNDLVKKAKKDHFTRKREAYFTNMDRHQHEPRSSYYFEVMLKYDHARRALIESFRDPKSLDKVLRSLQILAHPSAPSPHYYPGAGPKNHSLPFLPRELKEKGISTI
ncbi:uncharacterized protein BDZ99DRAFT_569544 [Mytilinidion resinicola]|uniref:Uncharacterized protein n=1 Tax=Mytilinidion resinicola TaxID=574789 RepID=A0A6A6YU13_9PEZI|nr:uncharacterized protein BDZ99DRAFT_569544 [Mytilinidion resinicola]KAF2811514.1 hypothetical protein BDZ99DRAFT_569544 [Mytilinidion resinicola]